MEPSEDFEALSKKNPGRLKYKQMDVTDEESVKKAVDDIVDAEGAIHGMIANAGKDPIPNPRAPRSSIDFA